MKEKLNNIGIRENSYGKLEFSENLFSKELLKKYMLGYCNNSFYIYNSNYWRELHEAEVRKLCKWEFDSISKDLWKFNYENKYLNTLKIDSELITLQELNKYPYKLNFFDKVYNFKTQKIEEHSKLNLFTYINDYKLEEAIQPTPLFDKVLEITSNGREELAEYIEELMAYIISGNKTEQRFFIFKGSGGNGKSTLLNLIIKLLGDKFTANISLSRLGGQFSLSAVVGKKLVVASENEGQNRAISTEILKQISSGNDLVSIEEKYKTPYSTRIQVELIFSVNNTIKFSENSYGLQRRLTVIPFDGVIEKIEPDFEQRLELEIPSIMRRLIKTYDKIVKRGYRLPICNIVEEETKEFFYETFLHNTSHHLISYFKENLIEVEGHSELKENFYSHYIAKKGNENSAKFWRSLKKWCEYENIKLEERRNGKRFIVGLELKENMALEDKKIDVF